jgi:exodeoxyribonuclease VII small subunit
MSDESTPTFRAELERLEAIVRSLEDSDVDLDQALGLFEEGVRRLKTARALLAETELRVKRVLEDADGTIRTDDLSL